MSSAFSTSTPKTATALFSLHPKSKRPLYEYGAAYADNADQYAEQYGDLGRLAFLKGQVSLDSLRSFSQAVMVKLATSLPENEFETQAAPRITDKFLIPGGKAYNKGVTISISHENRGTSPVVISFDIYDAKVPERSFRHMRTKAVLPGQRFDTNFTWFGETHGGKVITQPYLYITRAKLRSGATGVFLNTAQTRIKTDCGGYYNHYPKTLPLDRLQHIEYRHSARFFDEGFKAIFQRQLNSPISNTKLNKQISQHQWAPKEKGKGRLYPKNWSLNDISSAALSLTNDFDPLSDKCSIQLEGTYLISGKRLGIDLDAIASSSTSKIVTAYPPDGPQPIVYYLSPEGKQILGLIP